MCLAIPGTLERRSDDDPLMPMGVVRFGGVSKEVCLACTPEARIGDYVLVHVGMAIGVLDEQEAQRVLHYLEEIGEIEAARREMAADSEAT